MSKAPVKRKAQTSRLPRRPAIKCFQVRSWFDHHSDCPEEFITHILKEIGRLGLELDDIERNVSAPHTQTVLSDLLAWLSSHPGEAYAKLVDWQRLDMGIVAERLQLDRAARPRIEISAEITKMNNLTVRWHPAGWQASDFAWDRKDRDPSNQITHRAFRSPPDFRWFAGDEQAYFNSRASNELMYIRGVGNLSPEPREDYGPYAKFNRDVLDSLLICAARAAYNALLGQLRHSFEVSVLSDFDFDVRDEPSDEINPDERYPKRRVVAWRLGPKISADAASPTL